METNFHTLQEMQMRISRERISSFLRKRYSIILNIRIHAKRTVVLGQSGMARGNGKGRLSSRVISLTASFSKTRQDLSRWNGFPISSTTDVHEYTISKQEQIVLETIKEHESLLSKEIKKLCGYVKPRMPKACQSYGKTL